MYEGRDASGEFNLTIYKSYNQDLEQAFGDNYTAYFSHWLTNGKAEGRKAYDPNIVTNFTGMTNEQVAAQMALNSSPEFSDLRAFFGVPESVPIYTTNTNTFIAP